MLNPGTKVGHYSVVEKIGAGAMGEVYRATDTRLERDVAIKVLPAGTLADESARKRFRKEALTLSKLNHPHIATVHDFDTQEGVDFLVMEYVAGETLAAKLKSGPLPEKETAKLGGQVAEALEEAHEHGVVHRDLKPGNIALTAKGQVKVLDFGIAKLLRSEKEAVEATTESFPNTQTFAGTLPYMAPEQVRGEAVDARTDIHALGAVLYEMATGQRPFPETQGPWLIDAILHQPPVTPRALNSRVSQELERIILKCLEKEAEDRFQSAKEVEVDLRRLKRDSDLGRAAVVSAAATRAKKRWKLLVPVAALLAVLAAATVWQFRPAQALTESDFILMTDLVNTTGDEVFDGTLKAGLEVKLEESPFLNIVPERQVRETLRLMERSPDEQVTPEIGQQLCVRLNTKAMLTGEIAPLGSSYVITLNAVNCLTGGSLAREQVQAGSKEEVLDALGRAGTALRERLGESLASIDKFDTPLPLATTSSLEALRTYNLGKEQFWKLGEEAAIPFYERAIDLDPNFAMAYLALATAYGNLGEGVKANEHRERAYELRDRVSEREKLRIAYGYDQIHGDFHRTRSTLELWKKTYPRDYMPPLNLAAHYLFTGQYEKAAEEAREALRLRPNHGIALGNLIIAYQGLNRFQEAKALLEKLVVLYPGDLENHNFLFLFAFVDGDAATMQRIADSLKGTSGEGEALSLDYQSRAAAFSGKLQAARELKWQAADVYRRQDLKESAAFVVARQALIEAELGTDRQAREQAAAALAVARGRPAQAVAALALARSGLLDRAQALADDLARRFPSDTLLNAVWLPTVRAANELHRGNPTEAIDLLQAATPYELGIPWDFPAFAAIYVRGQASLGLGAGMEAVTEFQKILDHRGVDPLSPLYALAHLGLGRAYALAGDTTSARRAYQDFLALWKDADPDIPILQQAQAEYAKLQ